MIASSLPGKSSASAELVESVVAGMKRRGFVNGDFFQSLREARDSRVPDINRVAEVWRNKEARQAETFSESERELGPATIQGGRTAKPQREARVPELTGSPDVLVITALREELQALLDVKTGVLEGWTQRQGSRSTFHALLEGSLGPIRVAATRLTRMGGVATASAAAQLIEKLSPRCLAMCGVCAGHPKDTSLGDVVIADRLFYHDDGKIRPEGHYGDLWIDSLRDDWLHVAQELEGPAHTLEGYAKPSGESWRWWLLEQLAAGRAPRKSTAFKRFFPDESRASRLQSLLDAKQVTLTGKDLTLTTRGESQLHQHRFLHDIAVVELPFHIHVGPIGSGNAVEASGEIWNRLASGGMRKVLGIEMEAAAIGRVAHERSLPFAVAKGVMDHADTNKTDRFKTFAAQASAEVLCSFLRRISVPQRDASCAGEFVISPAHESKQQAPSEVSATIAQNDHVFEYETREVAEESQRADCGPKKTWSSRARALFLYELSEYSSVSHAFG